MGQARVTGCPAVGGWVMDVDVLMNVNDAALYVHGGAIKVDNGGDWSGTLSAQAPPTVRRRDVEVTLIVIKVV